MAQVSQTFVVGEREKGKRLDKFLAEKIPEISRTVLGNLADDGCALVDGKVAPKKERLLAGQTIEFTMPKIEEGEILAEEIPFEVLHEDPDLVIVNKPPGVCVHPAPGHWTGTMVNALLSKYPEMAVVGSVKRPGVVHRLDLETSGSIIFARTSLAYNGLTGLIKAKRIKREYLAVVYGEPEQDSATINMAIGRDPLFRRRFAVHSGTGSRTAVTHFDVLERFGIASLLRCRLETGRTHQIRVHMRRIGHPICGDKTYAREWRELPIKRQALHAHTLEFPHPRTGATISVEAPIPKDFEDLVQYLRYNKS